MANPIHPLLIAKVLKRFSLHPAKNTLNAGDSLSTGGFIRSNAGENAGGVFVPKFQVIMQSDGNLVLYCKGKPIWASNTMHKGAYAVMQTDGNLVVYDADSHPVWASGTHGYPGAHAVMQDDGNFVIYSAANKPLWASRNQNKKAGFNLTNVFLAAALSPLGVAGAEDNITISQGPPDDDGLQGGYQPAITSEIMGGKGMIGAEFGAENLYQNQSLQPGQSIQATDGSYIATFQTDGNLVVYDRSGKAVWASGTNGKGATVCTLQGDGNLVIYNGNQPLWATGTNGKGSNCYLDMQGDGNLVLYDGNKKPLWASNDHKDSGGGFLGLHIDIFNAAKQLVPQASLPAFNAAAGALAGGSPILQVIRSVEASSPAAQTGAAAAVALAQAHTGGMVSFGPDMSNFGKAGGLFSMGSLPMVMPPGAFGKIQPTAVVQLAAQHPAARPGAVAVINAVAAKKSLWARIKGWFGLGVK